MDKTRYKEYKANNKCPNCGNKASDGFVYCSSCRKNNRKKYTVKIYPDGKKMCIDCGKKIEITNKRTSIRCIGCQRKYNNKWARDYYKNHPDKRAKIIAYSKERYQRNKDKYNKQERNRRIFNLYGITESEYTSLIAKQNGECAICGEAIGITRKAFIDHNHSTGKARGLLCSKCNFGLGHFNDDVSLLQQAINYLSFYKKLDV